MLIVAALREDLGDEAFAEAEAEGAALELADALAMGFAMSLSAR
jgi:hypothetical protein